MSLCEHATEQRMASPHASGSTHDLTVQSCSDTVFLFIVAWYTIDLDRQSPSRRHCAALRQLHVLAGGGCGWLVVAVRTRLPLIMLRTFCIQLQLTLTVFLLNTLLSGEPFGKCLSIRRKNFPATFLSTFC